MALNPRITDLGRDVRMDWTPDAKAQGYRLYVDGQAVSRTFKPSDSSTTFRKPDGGPHRYGLRLMDEVGPLEEVTFPQPTPDPGELPFDPPALDNPLELTVTTLDGGFTLPSSSVGRDVLVDLERKARQGLVVTDNAAGAPRNLRVVNGHSRCTKPYSGSGYWHGGIRFQTRARTVAVLDFFNEARGIVGITGTDGIGIVSSPTTDWFVGRCLVEMPDDSPIPGAHIDAIQVQGPLRSLKVGLCSLDLAGVRPPNHAGKGLQLAQEPWNEWPGNPFTAELEQVDFLVRGNPPTGARAGVSIVQEFRDGPAITFGDEVYWACPDNLLAAQGDSFPVTVYPHLRTATDYGVMSGSRPNRKLSWATKPAAGIRGEFKERSVSAPRFVTREMLGY
jgi:hypothetical protein